MLVIGPLNFYLVKGNMATKWKHRLSNVNLELKIADCSHCGKGVEIRVKPDGRRSCRNREREAWKTSTSNYREKRYGLANGAANEMLKLQNGKCGLCECEITLSTSHIDHDHETDRVRKLLCADCNIGLGRFKDNPEVLMRASKYILDHK